MAKDNLILIDEFCQHHQVEIEFLMKLQSSGLLQIITVNNHRFIPYSHLSNLEQIIRLYYDLDINVEGIETIIHLLQKNITLQNDITQLKNRLRLYELNVYNS